MLFIHNVYSLNHQGALTIYKRFLLPFLRTNEKRIDERVERASEDLSAKMAVASKYVVNEAAGFIQVFYTNYEFILCISK